MRSIQTSLIAGIAVAATMVAPAGAADMPMVYKAAPVVVQVLEGDNAIAKYREIMGATDPAKAADGTIRKLFAKSVGENSVHGSDAADTAAKEIAQFFSGNEIVG